MKRKIKLWTICARFLLYWAIRAILDPTYHLVFAKKIKSLPYNFLFMTYISCSIAMELAECSMVQEIF